MGLLHCGPNKLLKDKLIRKFLLKLMPQVAIKQSLATHLMPMKLMWSLTVSSFHLLLTHWDMYKMNIILKTNKLWIIYYVTKLFSHLFEFHLIVRIGNGEDHLQKIAWCHLGKKNNLWTNTNPFISRRMVCIGRNGSVNRIDHHQVV